MIELVARRSFLVGLGAAFAAPVIVRYTSLMPVRQVDLYNTRYLWAYQIDTDSMILRVDRALHVLPVPKSGAWVVPEHIALKLLPRGMVQSLRPSEGQQQNITARVTARDFAALGWQP